jgi:hypothetical protein
VNLAWAAGHGIGSAAGGTVAKATSDAVPPALVAGCVGTLWAAGRGSSRAIAA